MQRQDFCTRQEALIDRYRAMKNQRTLGGKPAPLPLRPPCFSLVVTRDWNRAIEVRNQRIWTWAMTRLSFVHSFFKLLIYLNACSCIPLTSTRSTWKPTNMVPMFSQKSEHQIYHNAIFHSRNRKYLQNIPVSYPSDMLVDLSHVSTTGYFYTI